jgi:hypothetical protein
VNIPIQPSPPAFDVLYRPRQVFSPLAVPVVGKPTASLLGTGALDPDIDRRDVGADLDRLFARLLSTASTERSSRASLNLGAGAASTSKLTSTGPLNGAGSSFEKVELRFAGGSGVARLSGSFAGTGAAAGARSLQIDVEQAALLGTTPSPLKFSVRDQDGAVLFSFDGEARAGQAISLGSAIGLDVRFSAGTLLAGGSARTAVSASRGTDVDPNAAFDAADANLRPRFEGGAQVTAGSFAVNGTRIEVRADDNINSLLARINENVPDVVASFADDRITLATRANARQDIQLGDDSSGFLQAARLQGAVTARGEAAPGQELLASSSQFAGVRAGAFKVGGALVTVDPGQDTLAALLARITEAAPGVVAFIDRNTSRLVLRGSDEDRVVLGEDSTGFLEAAGLSAGREPAARERFTLAPGVAERLERGASDRRATLLDRVLAGLALPDNDQSVVIRAGAEVAKRAQAAYERAGQPREAALADTGRTRAPAQSRPQPAPARQQPAAYVAAG